MQTIGLIGGMSWESTLEYYRLVNRGVRERLGGLHSARCVIYSVDFAELEVMQREGRWDGIGLVLASAARNLERAGADFFLLCTNTMHRVADALTAAVTIPFLHIADATALAVRADGVRTVGLLGTRFTMEEAFYADRLTAMHGLTVMTPPANDRALVHRVIYDELCVGVTRDASRSDYLRIIDDLAAAGAEAIILGCTEIGLLVDASSTSVRLYDTTRVHAAAAVERALG